MTFILRFYQNEPKAKKVFLGFMSHTIKSDISLFLNVSMWFMFSDNYEGFFLYNHNVI